MILAIYGTGGGGRETFQVYMDINKERNEWKDVVFIDDTKPSGMFKNYKMFPYWQFREIYSPKAVQVQIALGEVKSRKIVAEKVLNDGYSLATLIHPRAVLGENVKIGSGCQIKMGAILHDSVVLGDGCWVQAYANIGYGSQIEPFCMMGAKTSLGANCYIGTTSFMGMHSSIRDNIVIGTNVIVSMGASIIEDIPNDITCMGSPARMISKDVNHKVFFKK